MNVGVLGSGEVGTILAAGFQAHGHKVMVGARTAAKLEAWAKQNPKIQIGTFAAAAQFGELLVLAVKGSAAPEALRAATAKNLSGKPVIDATNPVTDAAPTNGVLSFFTSLDQSSMERLQREFADVRFVKAFNSVGSASMVNPKFKGGKPTLTPALLGREQSCGRQCNRIRAWRPQSGRTADRYRRLREEGPHHSSHPRRIGKGYRRRSEEVAESCL